MTLDGATQPGFAGTPLIVLDGTFAGPSADGLAITGGNSTIRDLVIHGFQGAAVVLSGAGGDTITGDYIGTDFSGNFAFPNGKEGIFVDGSSHNTIGGTTSGSGNVVSANGGSGIAITEGSGNMIEGNKIGTDAAGKHALGNAGFGIRIIHGTNNEVGGTTPEAANVISANERAGVLLDAGSTGNVLAGNEIGTDANGSAGLGNHELGVDVSNASDNNTIGGTAAGAGNVISGNLWSGVVLTTGTSGTVVQNNFIGTNAGGTKALPNIGYGIRIHAANDNTIGGTAHSAGNVISGNGKSGIYIDDGSDMNQVQGNYVGTNASGNAAIKNGQRGIEIEGSSINEIGGVVPGSANLISGNTWAGIMIEQNASGNRVQGNFIGTDKSGTKPLGNGASGVHIHDSSNNLIGGPVSGSANVISGNDQDGVWIDGGASANLVLGNSIGTNIGGTTSIGNKWNGVAIGNASNNIIGGTGAGAPNTIENNLQNGVLVSGPHAVGNTITANTIYMNGLGILLSHGGNGGTAPPTLSGSVMGNNTARIEGEIVGEADTTYTVNFYDNTGTDLYGREEGQIFMGSRTVTTDSKGIGRFKISLDPAGSSGDWITATATDPLGNTSAFSTPISSFGQA